MSWLLILEIKYGHTVKLIKIDGATWRETYTWLEVQSDHNEMFLVYFDGIHLIQ